MNLFKILFSKQFKRLNSLDQNVIKLENKYSNLIEYIFKEWKIKNNEKMDILKNEELFDYTSYDAVNGFKDFIKYEVIAVSESALFFKETNFETSAFRIGYFKTLGSLYSHEYKESFEEYTKRMIENPYQIREVKTASVGTKTVSYASWISEQKLLELKTKTELYQQITANANSEKKEEENT
jgi:hypothetical protein